MNNRDLAILFFRDWLDDYRSGMGFPPVLTPNIAEEAYAALLAFQKSEAETTEKSFTNCKNM